MADREYKIVLENKADNPKQSQTSAPTSNSTGESDAGEKSLNKGVVKGTAVAMTAINLIDRYVVSPQINTITLRTGYEGKQQRAEFAQGLAKRSLSLASSIAVGLAVGGGAGALAGAVFGVGSELINIAIRQNEIAIKNSNENTQIFYNRIRMGAGNNREGKTQ